MADTQNQSHHIALFKGKEIRKTIYKKNGGFQFWISLVF